jgi:hypothetical protein
VADDQNREKQPRPGRKKDTVSQRSATNRKKPAGRIAGARNISRMEAGKQLRPAVTNKRVEIKSVALKDGGQGFYWRWRWQDESTRFSAYGGRIDTLNNAARLRQYWRNRRRYQNR